MVGKTADGADRLVRQYQFDEHSEAAAALLEDERFLRLGEITGDGHQSGRTCQALTKPIGVVSGISDVPWHKDCGLGRHSYDCCGMTVGISVTGAGATTGQLRVIAGSHRGLVWPAFSRKGTGLPEIDLPTETGDVTVHLSCTTHMSQPPVDRERRVIYSGSAFATRRPRRSRIRAKAAVPDQGGDSRRACRRSRASSVPPPERRTAVRQRSIAEPGCVRRDRQPGQGDEHSVVVDPPTGKARQHVSRSGRTGTPAATSSS